MRYPFIGLSLGMSFRSAVKDYKDTLNEYTSSLFSLSISVAVVFSIIILGLSKVIDMKMSTVMIFCCIVQSYMQYVLNAICVKYMMEIKYIERSLLLSLPNLLTAIISIVMIHFLQSKKYWGRIIPYVFIYTIFSIPILLHYFWKGRTFYNWGYWKYALSYSLPLVFHSLSVVILSSSDRIMISNMRNSSEVGIYSLVYNLSMAVTVIQSTLEAIWIPWFTKHMLNNEKVIVNRIVKYYIEVVSILVGGLLMVAPEIIKLISPSTYWDGIKLSIPIILASFIIFLYSISVDLEYYYKSTKFIAVNTAISAFINLVLNYIFIPKYGAEAAAYATVVSYLVSFILHYYRARKIDNELFPISKYIPSIIFVVGVSSISYIFINVCLVRYMFAAIIGIGYLLIVLVTDRRKILNYEK